MKHTISTRRILQSRKSELANSLDAFVTFIILCKMFRTTCIDGLLHKNTLINTQMITPSRTTTSSAILVEDVKEAKELEAVYE